MRFLTQQDAMPSSRYPSPAEARSWHARLRGFRHHPSPGGHFDTGDGLYACLPCRDVAEIRTVAERLGIPLAPQAIPGCFPWRVADPDTGSGIIPLHGIPTYMTVGERGFSLQLSAAEGDPWQITRKDFENALALEQWLAAQGMTLEPG